MKTIYLLFISITFSTTLAFAESRPLASRESAKRYAQATHFENVVLEVLGSYV
ncbi:hypothetical protein [Chitinolyticbacter albus]|uniref:hypothetical protein n=1 Tax=Chitinolyticbacter albus TaxID=2961951 RepID=UPI00210BF620|nr:hypothetical protein [Chitinolyticbacter albus]